MKISLKEPSVLEQVLTIDDDAIVELKKQVDTLFEERYEL